MLEELNAVAKITATQAPAGANAAKADTTLPDPTRLAKSGLAALIVLAAVLALVLGQG